MREIRLTLKNYRAFEDSAPLVIGLREGFTAFVGPNNSGKSSFLKFFYEFRQFWSNLTGSGFLATIAGGGEFSIDIRGVSDQFEVLNDVAHRPMSIQVDLVGPIAKDQISRLTLQSGRTPSIWTASTYFGPAFRHTAARDSSGNLLNPDNANVRLDAAWLLEWGAALGGAIYVGPYRNAIAEASASYFDLPIGTQFISQWNSLKTGDNKQQNRLTQQITEDIRQVFRYESLEINASQDQKTLHVVVDNKPYKLRELGAGLSQFIVVLGYIAIRKPSLLLIDEPELNLHPALQSDFLRGLVAYTGTRTVLFATHSLALARATAERIYAFQRLNAKSIVKPFEQAASLSQFLGEMSFASFREIGYDAVLMVEGATEVKAIQEFLRQFGKDHRVVVLSLGGSNLIRDGVDLEMSELTRLGVPIHVLIDSERLEAGGAPPDERLSFETLARSLGFQVLLTERRAFENYLSEAAIKAVKGDKYRALGPFEKLADAPLSWGKHENWRIARAMQLADLEKSDIGIFLQKI